MCWIPSNSPIFWRGIGLLGLSHYRGHWRFKSPPCPTIAWFGGSGHNIDSVIITCKRAGYPIWSFIPPGLHIAFSITSGRYTRWMRSGDETRYPYASFMLTTLSSVILSTSDPSQCRYFTTNRTWAIEMIPNHTTMMHVPCTMVWHLIMPMQRNALDVLVALPSPSMDSAGKVSQLPWKTLPMSRYTSSCHIGHVFKFSILPWASYI